MPPAAGCSVERGACDAVAAPGARTVLSSIRAVRLLLPSTGTPGGAVHVADAAAVPLL